MLVARRAMTLAGVDGCRGGWLCVVQRGAHLTAEVTPLLAPWLAAAAPALVVIDMPIGLPATGPRTCDRLARQALRPHRASSLFPAPVRGVLACETYDAACTTHRAIDARAVSRQTFFLLPKIRELDALLQTRPDLRAAVHEGHPELSFATWHGAPLAHAKRTAAGRACRTTLIESSWPGQVDRLLASLRGAPCAPDDLLDACALLWTACRLACGSAVSLPAEPPLDETGLRMCITA